MASVRALGPLLAVLLAVACDDTKKPASPPAPSAPPESTTPAPSAAASSPTPREATPAVAMPPASERKAIARSSNAFAFDLYARAAKAPGNLAMSPASITSALAMAWGGAKGKTDEQMKKVLHVTGERDAATQSWGKLTQAMQDPSRPLTLRIANRLFGEKTFAFEPSFLDRTKAAFGAPLEPLDFKGAPDASRQTINAWVEDRTERRIKDLLPPPAISKETRFVIVNAIYFLADWLTPFEKRSTSAAPFTTSAGASKSVPTMHLTMDLEIAKGDGVRMLALPYKGDDAAMYIALPDKADGLGALEKSIDAKKLDMWAGALKRELVDLALPSFKIEPGEPMALGPALKEMGMTLAFDSENADFTGISAATEPAKRLAISEVFHKAFVRVDEKGTEAAAATAVAMAGTGVAPKPTEFHADHPFLFFIVDRPSGLVLFMGRVADPSAS
jgi:serpin B